MALAKLTNAIQYSSSISVVHVGGFGEYGEY